MDPVPCFICSAINPLVKNDAVGKIIKTDKAFYIMQKVVLWQIGHSAMPATSMPWWLEVHTAKPVQTYIFLSQHNHFFLSLLVKDRSG